MDGQGTRWRRNIAENFNRLSREHERYRQTTDDRQTDGRRHIANVNLSSRSLIKMQIANILKLTENISIPITTDLSRLQLKLFQFAKSLLTGNLHLSEVSFSYAG